MSKVTPAAPTAAGAAATPEPAEQVDEPADQSVDAAAGAEPLGPGRRRWAARWQPVAVAVVAVVLLGGGAAVITATQPGRVPPAGLGAAPAPVPWSELLVRDGDTVAASGLVLALPGLAVRLCAPAAVVVPRAPAGLQPPAYCEAGVTLHGADLSALGGRTEAAGAVWGDAWIEGTFRNGNEVTVTRQGPPQPGPDEPEYPRLPPCPAPAGGWQPGSSDFAALSRQVTAHPDRYSDLSFGYPSGIASPGPGYVPTQVALVGTVGDPATAERELRPLYAGNLCVFRIPHARSAVAAGLRRVQTSYLSNLVFEAQPDYPAGRVRVRLVVINDFGAGVLRDWDGGSGIIDARPWLRPVR
jgi:hypothetical protein